MISIPVSLQNIRIAKIFWGFGNTPALLADILTVTHDVLILLQIGLYPIHDMGHAQMLTVSWMRRIKTTGQRKPFSHVCLPRFNDFLYNKHIRTGFPMIPCAFLLQAHLRSYLQIATAVYI